MQCELFSCSDFFPTSVQRISVLRANSDAQTNSPLIKAFLCIYSSEFQKRIGTKIPKRNINNGRPSHKACKLLGIRSTIAQIITAVERTEKRKTPARMGFLGIMLQSLTEPEGGYKGWKAKTKLGECSLFEFVKAQHVIRLLQEPKCQREVELSLERMIID